MTATISGPRIGSLFSGYGGLDMGVQAVIGGSVAWHVEFADAPSKVLAYHWPEIPNYGDITAVDWSSVEPIDVLTGGFPCQDLSLAGRRAGMREGTRSGLWADYLKAIDVLRPKLVVIENVRGLLSGCAESEADSELGPCPRCADPSSGTGHAPNVRAIQRVQLDLTRLGYVGRWGGLRAADAGAPHNRFRVFVVAYPSGHEPERWRELGDVGGAAAGDKGSSGQWEWIRDAVGDRGSDVADSANVGHQRSRSARDGRDGSSNDGLAAGDADNARLEGRRVSGERAGERSAGSDGVGADTWGRFWPAIQGWEPIVGRLAPPATVPDGKGGSYRLSPEFVEWMMGLLRGHVTAPAIGLTRTEQIKALGNGVVWQQAALALTILLGLQPHSSGNSSSIGDTQ